MIIPIAESEHNYNAPENCKYAENLSSTFLSASCKNQSIAQQDNIEAVFIDSCLPGNTKYACSDDSNSEGTVQKIYPDTKCWYKPVQMIETKLGCNQIDPYILQNVSQFVETIECPRYKW